MENYWILSMILEFNMKRNKLYLFTKKWTGYCQILFKYINYSKMKRNIISYLFSCWVPLIRKKYICLSCIFLSKIRFIIMWLQKYLNLRQKWRQNMPFLLKIYFCINIKTIWTKYIIKLWIIQKFVSLWKNTWNN